MAADRNSNYRTDVVQPPVMSVMAGVEKYRARLLERLNHMKIVVSAVACALVFI